MAHQKISLNRLWQSAPLSKQSFQPVERLELPDPVRRYLQHAISLEGDAATPKTPLATAVRLRMHGEIMLKGWQSFRAEQVICYRQGMIWQATVWMNGLPIVGWDRLVAGEGAMQWKLLGLLPVMKAQGADITRSVIGRMQGEYVWLPSALLDKAVEWTAADDTHIYAELALLNETTSLNLTINEAGGLQEAYFKRWGDPEETGPHYENFGVIVEDERTFFGYTIPSRFRAGWYFSSERFESEGEFFRATIDDAIYQ